MLLIGTKNTTSQTVPTGGLINLGSVYRKYCKKNSCGVKTFEFTNNAIALQQQGMYLVKVSATFTGTAAGTATIQLLENGVAVPGVLASQTITTAGTEIRSISFDYFVLVDSTCLLGNVSTVTKNISLQNTGVGTTITSLIVDVLKVS